MATACLWLTRPHVQTYEEGISAMESRDPKIGSKFRLSDEMKADPATRHLILLVGACNGCSVDSGDLTRLDLSGWSSVVAVSSADEIDESLLPRRFVFVELVNDSYYHQELNAFWVPRLAVLDSQGTLIALQVWGEDPAAFTKRIQ